MTLDYPEPPTRRKAETLARREMDALLTQGWDERFTFLSDQVIELMRTVRGFNGTPGLCQKMERVETLQKEMSPKVDEIYLHMLGEKARAEVTAKLKDEIPQPKDQPLTKGSLALVVLVFGAGIMGDVIKWLLTDFFPQLFAKLGP